MKTLNYFMIMALLVVASCAQAPDSDKAKVEEAKPVEKAEPVKKNVFYRIDSNASKVSFIGTKPTGQHTGDFKLKNGTIALDSESGTIKGGSFVIDVKSLAITDLEGETAEKLKGHLLSADFFKSDDFPVSQFVISKVEPIGEGEEVKLEGASHKVTGNLRLLDQTKSINFPAVINISNEEITAKADFNINRSDFGMSYGNDQSLGDKFIRPEVNITLDLKMVK